jgi:hypothetical protein
MLSELYFPLTIIGITETKLKVDQDLLSDINLPGTVISFYLNLAFLMLGELAFSYEKT